MKHKLLVILTAIVLSSCIKDVLDRKPLNLISDADVWQSKELVEVYLTALYDALPIGFPTGSAAFQSFLTDESCYHEEQTVVDDYGAQAALQNRGIYTWIRRANYFLEHIQSSTLTDDEKKSLTAECRFLRAYYYFDLVKKYGGMPIISEVQSFDGTNLETLQVPRNKEDEVYEFIAAELDMASADLPEKWDAKNANRATRWVALALKSRAMLYAGSIAKYGNVQLDGLMGIPAQKAASYFDRSMAASKAIIDSKQFSLYTKAYDPVSKSGDPVANYQSIFLDKNNGEIIFQKAYAYPNKAHSFDNFNVPEGYTTNNGSAVNPTLEMAESYENIDGSPGKLVISDGQGHPIEYTSNDALFQNKDPRFAASVFRGGSSMTPRPLQVWRGIYDESGALYSSLSSFPKDPSKNQVGLDGPFETGNYSKTGFYLKKYLNTSTLIVEPGQSDQNYIDIRYAEILLNYAEAAFETGANLPEALDAVNLIRNRAGISLLTPADLTLDRIRNERKVELAFEDKRLWDIKRWRIATSLFQNTYMHGLWPYLKYNNGTYKYIYTVKSGYPIDGGLSRVFTERDYYSDLSSYIQTNKNIINNTGW